jgi:FemAB-related protein (PEP-CTERM system-associated)
MTTTVALLSRDWEKAYQQFVDDSPQATLGHLLAWRNVVQKTYHHIPYYLMAMDGQTIKSILPLFLIRSPFFGRFLVTAPYLSYGGLLGDDMLAAHALIHTARNMAVDHRAQYVEIRGLVREGQGLLLKDKYWTFVLPLSVGSDVLWKRFEDGKVRRAVRKALKSGVIVEKGLHLRQCLWEVMSRHMRDLGTPFHRDRFYQSIVQEFPDQANILMARKGDRYVGGILVISYKDTVYWLHGAGLREYKSLAPTSLLLWEAIRSASEDGFAYFDFGRSSWGSGTFIFKRKWGAQPRQLSYEYHLLSKGHLPDMDPMNSSFRGAIALWKRLPVGVAKVLGPLIIRDIP